MGINVENVRSVAALMETAAAALVARDTQALEELQRRVQGWLQMSGELAAQSAMLDAMLEAAYMLIDEPSDIEIDLEEC
jgi:hypothetical protein